MPTLEMILSSRELLTNSKAEKISTFAKQTGRFVYFTRQFALFPLKMVPV